MSTEQRFARDMLKSFVSRIENIESEIKELNSDKSDIYKEAKATGFDVKALKSVIAMRRKDPNEIDEHNAIVDLYLSTLNGQSETGTPVATRAGAESIRGGAPASIPEPSVIVAPCASPDDLAAPPFLLRKRETAEAV